MLRAKGGRAKGVLENASAHLMIYLTIRQFDICHFRARVVLGIYAQQPYMHFQHWIRCSVTGLRI